MAPDSHLVGHLVGHLQRRRRDDETSDDSKYDEYETKSGDQDKGSAAQRRQNRPIDAGSGYYRLHRLTGYATGQAVVDELGAGAGLLVLVLDVTETNSVATSVEKVAKLDRLVKNAGISNFGQPPPQRRMWTQSAGFTR